MTVALVLVCFNWSFSTQNRVGVCVFGTVWFFSLSDSRFNSESILQSHECINCTYRSQWMNGVGSATSVLRASQTFYIFSLAESGIRLDIFYRNGMWKLNIFYLYQQPLHRFKHGHTHTHPLRITDGFRTFICSFRASA